MERGEHERKRRHSHHGERDLKQDGVDLAALEPRVQEEQHEREDRNARCGERIRAIDVSCCKLLAHGPPLPRGWHSNGFEVTLTSNKEANYAHVVETAGYDCTRSWLLGDAAKLGALDPPL